MYTIDFHSHILPGIDDGAKNAETSLAMLSMAAAQHVDVMIATPHFYASHDRIERFLEKREVAWQKLQNAVAETETADAYPKLYTGAEVAFFDGISRADDIRKLTIAGTNKIGRASCRERV